MAACRRAFGGNHAEKMPNIRALRLMRQNTATDLRSLAQPNGVMQTRNVLQQLGGRKCAVLSGILAAMQLAFLAVTDQNIHFYDVQKIIGLKWATSPLTNYGDG